jgi:hypothetical protein
VVRVKITVLGNETVQFGTQVPKGCRKLLSSSAGYRMEAPQPRRFILNLVLLK